MVVAYLFLRHYEVADLKTLLEDVRYGYTDGRGGFWCAPSSGRIGMAVTDDGPHGGEPKDERNWWRATRCFGGILPIPWTTGTDRAWPNPTATESPTMPASRLATVARRGSPEVVRAPDGTHPDSARIPGKRRPSLGSGPGGAELRRSWRSWRPPGDAGGPGIRGFTLKILLWHVWRILRAGGR